jgi:membrane protease YdiL (CAAX protease family)
MPSVVTFFSLTYAVSWGCFVAAAALQRAASAGSDLPALATVLLYIGTFAPSLVALALTARSNGHNGVTAVLDRVFQAQVPVRWYAFAVGYMPAVKLTVALLHRVAFGAWPRFGDTPWYLIVGAIVVSTPVQAGEEIGWRGYALPRLAARLGFAGGSVLLGIIWAVWHVPLFFIPGLDNYGQSLAMFLVGGTALSVAMAWLYMRTAGSLLLTMLMHSAVNQTVGIVPSTVPGATNPFAVSGSLVGWLSVAVAWIAAAYLLVRLRHLESRPEKARRARSSCSISNAGHRH